MLINIEGIDGSGKNTQTLLLREYFEKKGRDVDVFSYPDYESVYGKCLHDFLHDDDKKLSVEEQFLLYLIDMVKDMDMICDLLDNEHVVILDRYYPSTIAYQTANGFNYDAAKTIITELQLICPNHVILIDIPPNVSNDRKMMQKGYTDKFEKNLLFLGIVRDQFHALFKDEFPCHWHMIDGTLGVNKVFDRILFALGEKHQF